MKRESLPTILELYRILEHVKANTLTEADLQMISVLLDGVANDKDVRDYFWTTIEGRPQKDQTMPYLAAMIVAVDDARGRAAGEEPRSKTLSSRKSIAQQITGLSASAMDRAWSRHGPHCRDFIANMSSDDLRYWKEVVDEKVRIAKTNP